MNVFYWNVRSFGNADTKIAFKNFHLSHKPTIMFLAEPMIPFANVPAWYWHSIDVTKFCTNNRDDLFPNLWALWGDDTSPIIIFMSS